MATSLGSNTYNRQNWEDAVSARRRRTLGRRGRAGWEAMSRAAAGSAGAVLRPSSAGQPEESPRASDQGPGTSAVLPETPDFPEAFIFFRLPEVQTAPLPAPRSMPELGLRPTLHPSPPQKVTEGTGSWGLDLQSDFPFSLGLPHTVSDVSWRKPLYTNGECLPVPREFTVHYIALARSW